ncbi:MAG TPA: hypothetical protein VH593_01680 [Ktedonobacteraceae bacterium]
MPGFLNPDGSELVGALSPSNVGGALRKDALGNLLVTDGVAGQVLQGDAYLASNGLVNAAAGNFPMGIFNPSNSGKNILIYSIAVSCGGTGFDAAFQFQATDPAFSKAGIVTNKKIGGSASAIAGSITYEDTSQTRNGPYARWEPYTSSPVDMVFAGSPVLLPAGSANALIVWVTTYGNGYSAIHLEWVEF